jgi:hypothetical protein
MKRGELYVADKQTLRMGGFSEKVASEIAAEHNLEAKSALIRSEWDKRTPKEHQNRLANGRSGRRPSQSRSGRSLKTHA